MPGKPPVDLWVLSPPWRVVIPGSSKAPVNEIDGVIDHPCNSPIGGTVTAVQLQFWTCDDVTAGGAAGGM